MHTKPKRNAILSLQQFVIISVKFKMKNVYGSFFKENSNYQIGSDLPRIVRKWYSATYINLWDQQVEANISEHQQIRPPHPPPPPLTPALAPHPRIVR